MTKAIKFDLAIDGVRVRNREELSSHFTTEVIGYFRTGLLERWLDSRKMDEDLEEQLESVKSINKNGDDVSILIDLCRTFGVDVDDERARMAVEDPKPAPVKSRSLNELARAWNVPRQVLAAFLPYAIGSRPASIDELSGPQTDALVSHLIARLRHYRLIGVGDKSVGRISSTVPETWVIALPNRRKLQIWTTGSLDTMGVLADVTGRTLATNDDGGHGCNFRLQRTLDPGVYTIAVSSYNSARGCYRLCVK